jgi:hypothetical protein
MLGALAMLRCNKKMSEYRGNVIKQYGRIFLQPLEKIRAAYNLPATQDPLQFSG